MRFFVALSAVVLGSLACGAAPPEGLVPTGDLAPARIGLEPYAGRWVALLEREGEAPVLAASCAPGWRFVEIRSDGIGGWELILGTPDEIRVLAATSSEALPDGLRIEAGEESVALTWEEPERIASFSAIPGARFVAPSARGGYAEASCE